jgi:hypothetical protein
VQYAILAYHQEGVVQSWTEDEDKALMADLMTVHERLVEQKQLGPAARLGPTQQAVTLRGKDHNLITDGPFAETKEQLLGLYVVDFPTIEGAIAAAQDLGKANPTAVYEIRPIMLYIPGAALA